MAKSRRERDSEEKSIAYAWVAYMFTHESKELKRVYRYGTPSDELIALAERKVSVTLADGTVKEISFPISLNKRSGQQLLYTAILKISNYVRKIPLHALSWLKDLTKDLKVRRADARTNILMIASAIAHRASCEFKPEILFAFDSINAWISAVHNKQLGYLTIRKALEVLQDQGFISVREWGKRGTRSRCTKIGIVLPAQVIVSQSETDQWLSGLDHGLMAVYSRESVTRQDVLEQKFYHYIDQVAVPQEESRYAQGARLFPSKSGKIIVSAEAQIIYNDKDITHDSVDINRLLGRLVHPVSQDEAHSRSIEYRIRGTPDPY